MTVRLRFAPSPTGRLHLGNARIAVINWLFARHHGGDFLVRMDDTDRARCRPEFAQGILEDLAWLGLDHQGLFHQSARGALYDQALEALKDAGRIYPCYETAEELTLQRRLQRQRGRPPVYDRAALRLSGAERAQLEAAGRRPHWRFLLPDRAITWDDMVRGPMRFEPGHASDPVLRRADGQWLYTLTSVVDDGDMGVSHVLRGQDHLANTAVQIALFEALARAAPCFGHLPLVTADDGRNLSKRAGSLALADLRAQGIEAHALVLYLARLGAPTAAAGTETRDQIAQDFDLAAFGRTAARCSLDEIRSLNARVLAHAPLDAVRDRLPEAVRQVPGLEPFWRAIRANIESLADAAVWRDVCYGVIAPVIAAEDCAFLAQAARLLPEDLEAEDAYERWTSACRAESGRRGRALFLPLRQALTGRDHGPELRALLPLIGRERAAARLRGDAGQPTPQPGANS